MDRDKHVFLLELILALTVPASFLVSMLVGRYAIPADVLFKMIGATFLPIQKTWPHGCARILLISSWPFLQM